MTKLLRSEFGAVTTKRSAVVGRAGTARPTLSRSVALVAVIGACMNEGPPPGPAPETSLLGTPPRLSTSREATFTFSASLGDQLECWLLEAPTPQPCSSPYTVQVTDGPHLFQVRAIGADGRADPSPASWSWTVDTAPPQTQLLEVPRAYDNSARPTFAFAAEPDALITCSLDGGPRYVCTSPHRLAPLTDGPHRFDLLATDRAGNVQAQPTAHSWTLDTSTPDVTFDETPPARTSATAVTFRFSVAASSSPIALTCTLDGRDVRPCSSPLTLTPTEGYRRLVILASNAVGLHDPTPATYDFLVDHTPPTMTLSAPSSPSNRDDLTYVFTTAEPNPRFECRAARDDRPADFAPCSSPYVLADAADGTYTVSVRLFDEAGNATTRTTTTVVDTVLPELTVTEAPATRSGDPTPTFVFHTTGADDVECRLDSGAWTPCTSPRTLSLVSGTYTHELRARDLAGNQTTHSTTFSIDTSAPFITFTAKPNPRTAASSTTFAFSVWDSDLQALECAYDAGSYAPCTSPVSIPSLTLGHHAFTVRATDELGNRAIATINFFADPRPIAITFIDPPTGVIADRYPALQWTSTENISTTCRYDAEELGLCSYYLSQPLSDGPHTFTVQISNDLGQTTTATHSFTVDTVAPSVAITGGPTGNVTTPAVTFTFVPSDDTATTECRLFRQGQATGAYAPCSSPAAFDLAPPSTPYPYTFEVRVGDTAGNLWSTYRNFTYAP